MCTFLSSILTVASVWNTGETGDIFVYIIISNKEPNLRFHNFKIFYGILSSLFCNSLNVGGVAIQIWDSYFKEEKQLQYFNVLLLYFLIFEPYNES